jgi:hypothetical protein
MEEISTVIIFSVDDAVILARADQEIVDSEPVKAVAVTPNEFSQSDE